MTFFKEKETDCGKLALEGELTLGHIRKLHEEIHRSLENAQHVEVDITGIVETDLSFLQLLCSAHRTAVKLGKTLNLAADLPQPFLQAMEDNGYVRRSGCSLDVNKTCLWARK